MNKQCTNCKQEKYQNEFYAIKSRPGQFRSQCKDCDREKSRKRMSDPAYCSRRLERLRKYRAKCATEDKPADGSQCCTYCHIEKPFAEFHKDCGVPTGRNTRCKKCTLKRAKSTYYSHRWGISENVIKQKLESQDRKCKICGKETKLVLDHNHETDIVRDFLCNHCNSGLGYLMDSEFIIANALEYLKQHRENPSNIKADL